MSVTESLPATGVDPEHLVCPGCREVVECAPPLGWPARAGAVPQFSHRDGSVLCPDSRGRFGEPVEAHAHPSSFADAARSAVAR